MPAALARTTRIGLVALLSLVVLAACGSGEGGSSARPSTTASLAPTRSVPTTARPSRPTPERSTRTAGPRESRPATASSTPAAAASQPAQSQASATPTPASATGESSGGDSSGWWWLLLAVLVIGGGLVFFLVRRSRTVHAWDSRLSAATSEVGWFARDLVPALRRSGSAAGVAGGWSVAAPRVTELEDDLSALVTTAPGDERRARAVAVRDAVRVSRERMSALAARGGAGWEAELDVVQAPLIAVLTPPEASAPSGR